MPPVRCQSPHAGRRDQLADTRERPRSRSRPGSPTYLTVTEPSVISRRSSPAGYPEQGGPAPFRSRSRSPAHHSPSRRSSYCDIRPDPEISETGKVPEDLDRPVEKDSIEHTKLAVNIPIQPRNLALRQSPPSGPSQGPKLAPTPNRGSQNLSLLSAPTRPRRGPASREGTWVGAPGARRGPPSTVPSGPRASFAAPAPGGGSYRHSTSRPGGSTPILSSAPKGPTHMTGLGSIIPGGRTLPSMLDAATERRLAQLEVDRERLLDQVLETQRSKRAGLRDWDRLDRESSICALKSELAEGHLQRMADESIRGGVLF
ncbi:hypothetical protein N7462_000258 [Penicillium macrosclerotiorum]|uniref:uncharacterized protein n=1 Tax=Penicillium macrosclerotiorum TaxID=303699 RepID=UPI002547628D|nr:uncharacterized protein N7462_000258 [Penicillium macrosclerotiorum]KAJ5698253.1 hypothetical protein N7462_000258 [Penicillium macrosclerotiorum]